MRVSRERNERSSEEFWSYVLRILNILKHDGMSDEEDTEQVVRRGEVQGVETVKAVLVLKFRNPYFRGLFELVDKTKGLESMVFNRAGKMPMKRIRVNAMSAHRQPPEGLPRNFLDDVFLASLLPHEEAALRLKQDFELRQFDNDSTLE